MKINDDGVDREMTPQEIAIYEKRAAEIQAELDEQIRQAEAVIEARKAPLRRLGLTDDEINVILGV